MTLAVGIDIGGTKIAAGVVSPDGTVTHLTRTDSPAADAAAITDTVTEMIAALAADQAAVVGVAAAGLVDESGANVRFAPNLAWRHEPLAASISERCGHPVLIENDATAAAWAESRFGAAVGARVALGITVGTGIGGGLVVEGQLQRGAFGSAGEVGHLRVVPDGRACACGLRGCWETYASGAVLRAAGTTGEELAAAASAGNPEAVQTFAEMNRWLGEGLASLVAVLDPDVIVVGGGLAQSPHIDLDVVGAALSGALSGAQFRPAIALRRAALGNSAGLVGAADLARGRLG